MRTLRHTIKQENHTPDAAFYEGVTRRSFFEEENEREALRAEIQRLKAANTELELFSNSLVHDLKVPLRAISAYAGTVAEDYQDVLDDEAKRCLAHILKNVSGMAAVIEGTLTFSRIRKGEVRKTRVDMSEAVDSAVIAIAKSKAHRVEIAVDSLHPVMADGIMIRQVMMNLLHNAIKYSSASKHPVVHVSSVQTAEEIIYSIRDNGIGFPMKYVDKLFNMFQRLHSPAEFEGTGVGLAVARAIIEKHGGRIWAEAEENVGATFYFSLPAYNRKT